MQTTDSPSPTSPNQRDWLKFVEYISVVASGVSSVVAAFLYRPILIAAAPLTIAVALNIFNRQRLEEQMQRNTEAAIADVRQVVKSLYDQVQLLPKFSDPKNDLDPITDVLTELQRVTQRLEHSALRQEDWEVMNVRFHLMEDTINEIKQQPPIQNIEHLSYVPISAEDFTKLQNQLVIVYQQVRELQNQNREIVKPYLQRLTAAIKRIEKS